MRSDKSHDSIENIHLAKAKKYLLTFNFEVGFLINFGATSLEWKKIFNNKFKPAG